MGPLRKVNQVLGQGLLYRLLPHLDEALSEYKHDLR